MTSQIPDTFLYEGEEYELVGVDGEKLITPQDYGMNPEMLHTACYRGFYCTYQLTNDGLFLTQMVIGKVEEGYQPIDGIMPKLPSQDSHSELTYQGLKLLTPFTGKLLLGQNCIGELSSGYEDATSYQTLLEFTLEAGKLVTMRDISAENAKNRLALFESLEIDDVNSFDYFGDFDDDDLAESIGDPDFTDIKFIFVYVTCQNRTEALTIGKAVVETHLAACANIIDGMDSIYWWNGELQIEKEAILIMKSRHHLFTQLTEKVKSMHSYEVPCIVTLPIETGNQDYLKWLMTETKVTDIKQL